MFEAIVLREPPMKGGRLDLGQIAEALLFYSNVQFLLNRSSLILLLKQAGPGNFLRLLDHQDFRFSYFRDDPCVLSQGPDSRRLHRFTCFEMQASADSPKKRMNREDHFRLAIERAGVPSSLDSARILRRLMERTSHRKVSDVYRQPDFMASLMSSVTAHEGISEQVAEVVDVILPGTRWEPSWTFRVHQEKDDTVSVETKADFATLEKAYVARYGETGFTPPYVLSTLFNAHLEMHIAAGYGSAFVTRPVLERLISKRVSALLVSRNTQVHELAAFQELTLEGAHALRESINSGERSFGEFLDLLDKAERFKGWLRQQNPDKGLIKSYYEECTKKTWIEKGTPKALRWLFFTAGGIVADKVLGEGAGIPLSAFDTWLVDRLAKGWRPDQFVQKQLLPFVDP